MLRLPPSLLVACLAVLALLTNPVAAAAAQVACTASTPGGMTSNDTPGMAMTPMAGGDHTQAQKTATDPCCDHGAKHKSSKDCAQACAIGCAVIAALPATQLPVSLVATPTASVPHPDWFGYAHDPSGLRRPPKFIA